MNGSRNVLLGAMSVAALAFLAYATPPSGELTGQKPAELTRTQVPANLLVPLPTRGGVPPMVTKAKPVNHSSEAMEKYSAQFRALKSKYFGQHSATLRQTGLAQLRAYTDAASLEPMWTVLQTESDDVRLAVMDHLAGRASAGQAILARIAIHDKTAAIRAEATRRIAQPPTESVLHVLDESLRSNEHVVVNNAGLLAGNIHAIEALPALIFAQFSQDTQTSEGDLAWIAIGTQRSYVQNLVPVTGDNSGAFSPVIGQVIEGVVMRVADCIVTTYRADVHNSLVSMSSFDTGTDTSYLAWDMRAWARWFNQEYVPMKQRQARELAAMGAGATRGE
jgi:hypothetical protein